MDFKDYFAIAKDEIRETCIICQGFDLPLFSKTAKNGLFVKTAQIENATIIALKNNFLAGDAVLRLKGSLCKNIILFGSCGGCGNVSIGDLLTINKAYNLESFTDMLEKNRKPSFRSCAVFPHNSILTTNSACVSSLLLEKDYIDFFKQNEISAIDMESSIIVSAANEIGAQVSCLFYVSDFIEAPFGAVLKNSEKQRVSEARKKATEIIKRQVKSKM